MFLKATMTTRSLALIVFLLLLATATVYFFYHNSPAKRSTAVRNSFVRAHPCPSTGKPSGPCPGYVVDHIKALKRGGADSPDNMQWQTVEDAKLKDRWE